MAKHSPADPSDPHAPAPAAGAPPARLRPPPPRWLRLAFLLVLGVSALPFLVSPPSKCPCCGLPVTQLSAEHQRRARDAAAPRPVVSRKPATVRQQP